MDLLILLHYVDRFDNLRPLAVSIMVIVPMFVSVVLAFTVLFYLIQMHREHHIAFNRPGCKLLPFLYGKSAYVDMSWLSGQGVHRPLDSYGKA